ncbi:hypothetical protein [Candidatus Electronema sp. TJ]|uniref:hypothetical protein n=1 Tax=Candidatus Electronema sp. TJ TaxID=3401573 RepID=UPI003AA96969
MTIEKYIADLQSTKTFGEGLMSWKEYKIEPKWFGFRTFIPDIPKADDERHVVILNFKGGYPTLCKVLTKESDKPEGINTTDLILFIFVSIKPRTMHIPSPQARYQLGDGEKIDADINITYRVSDAEAFWKSASDPLAQFEAAAIDAAKRFFLGITSQYLVRELGDLKNSLEINLNESHISNPKIKLVKDNLEASVSNLSKIPETGCGIEIIKVAADIYLSKTLGEHLERLHERIYKQDGIFERNFSLQETLLDRKQTDIAIDNDQTFGAGKLKYVAMALDPRLLENFYNMTFGEAMKKIHEEIKKQKVSYLSEQRMNKISALKDMINIAQEAGFDKEQIGQIRDKLHAEMMRDKDDNVEIFTDMQYVRMITDAAFKIEDKKQSTDEKQGSYSGDKEEV